MRTGKLCAIGIVAISLSVGSAKADLILGHPDITAQNGTVSYTSSTGAFSYVAEPETVATSSSPSNMYGIDDGGFPTFDLSATINSSGQVANGGTLTVSGTTANIPGWGVFSGTLLNASVTKVTPGTGDNLQFVLTVASGGTMTSLFGGVGTELALDLGYSGYAGTFGTSFNSGEGNAQSDVAPAPEPATLTMVLIGGCVLLAAGCRRKNPILADARRA